MPSARARQQPEVLDRQAGAVEVGVGDRVPAEHLRAGRASVAADADAERRLADSFDLQVEVLARTLVEILGLYEPFARGERLHPGLGLLAADDDEAPGLHQPDRRSGMRGLEQALERPLRERVRTEAPDVSTLEDRAPHRGALAVVEAPILGSGAPLARTRVVEARRKRRPREPLGAAGSGRSLEGSVRCRLHAGARSAPRSGVQESDGRRPLVPLDDADRPEILLEPEDRLVGHREAVGEHCAQWPCVRHHRGALARVAFADRLERGERPPREAPA